MDLDGVESKDDAPDTSYYQVCKKFLSFYHHFFVKLSWFIYSWNVNNDIQFRRFGVESKDDAPDTSYYQVCVRNSYLFIIVV